MMAMILILMKVPNYFTLEYIVYGLDEYINDLLDAMDYSITKDQARKALERKDWDFDKALDFVL